MPVPTPHFDAEIASARFRYRAAGTSLKLVPATAQTAVLITAINSDNTETFPTGYTAWGGVGVVGPVAGIKSTSGAPADTDFSGATPVVPVPPVGSMIYNTNTHKLCIRDAAASWLISSVFS